MAYIPEDILQDIKEAADIRQVIQEFVPLKKRGKNWVGLCPFHPEKDPSFTVNEEKQIYYCFGCGEGGNVFKFLMRIQGLSFVEAAKSLAQKYGINIPERPTSTFQKKKREERELLLEINKLACEYFRKRLNDSLTGRDAIEYLKKRGLSQETQDAFQVGWAEDSWDSLTKYLENKGFDLALVEKTGLIIKRASATGFYDRFRGRIVFPILDHRGDVVAFGARTIDLPGQEDQPKYINSPESPVYQKGNVLFGLFQNKSTIRQEGYGLVVEGYMDVVTLWQFGVRNAVATLGTALTEQHAKRMKGITKDWILIFDADEAGLKAAKRALPICYGVDIRPKVLVLSSGEDPDSFLRRYGKSDFDKLLQEAPSGIDFLIEMGIKQYGKDTEGRLKTIEDLIEAISPIKDSVRKSLFIGHISQKLGVREESLWERLSVNSSQKFKIKKEKKQDEFQKAPIKSVFKITNRAEEKLLGFILSYPQYIESFLDMGLEIWLRDKKLLEIWNAITNLFSMEESFSLSLLFERLETRPEIRTYAMKLVSDFPPFSDIDKMAKELLDFCERQKKKILRMQLLEQLRQEDLKDGEDEKILRHLQGLR